MSDGERMLSGLLAASHLVPLEAVPAVVAEHAAAAGIFQTMIYVSDLQSRFLAPLPDQRDEAGRPLEPMGVDATVAGRAYRNVEVVRLPASEAAEHGASRKMWVPLLDGTDRVGVLGLTTCVDDEDAERHAISLASLIGLLVVSKRASSDAYARLVRAERMTLSAEVLWNLMPPGTIANDEIVVSAVLEPAYEVGGDAYDYATDGHTVHLSIFDAMGHDTEAGLTASVAIGCYRNTRRRGTDLLTISETIDEAIAEQFAIQRFATGILATLDTGTGSLTWINRGHHPPLVIRHGRQVATLETTPSPPMGLRLGATVGPATYQLEPGDRLLFYTDGIIEARNPDNELFGLERFIDFVIRREADGMPAPETLRRLVQTILDHQRGVLQDDATVVLVEWRAQRHDRLTL